MKEKIFNKLKNFKFTEKHTGPGFLITIGVLALASAAVLILNPRVETEFSGPPAVDLNTLSEPAYEKVLCENSSDPRLCVEKRRKKVEDWRKENPSKDPEPTPTTLTDAKLDWDPIEWKVLIEFCRKKYCEPDFDYCEIFLGCEEA